MPLLNSKEKSLMEEKLELDNLRTTNKENRDKDKTEKSIDSIIIALFKK